VELTPNSRPRPRGRRPAGDAPPSVPAAEPARAPRASGRGAKPAKTERTGRTGSMPVSVGHLADMIAFNLRLSQDASFRAFRRHAGEKYLRPGRFAAMMVIHNSPGISQSALSRAIARDKSTMTPLIRDLDRRGLVDRRPSPTDGRSVTLRLTPAGEVVLKELLKHANEHDRALDRLIGDDKAALIAMLRKIADGLR
jgi:DNA-binding MarR family transcriptional regulator